MPEKYVLNLKRFFSVPLLDDGKSLINFLPIILVSALAESCEDDIGQCRNQDKNPGSPLMQDIPNAYESEGFLCL